MLEAIAAMVVVLGIGFLMAHAMDAFRYCSHSAERPPPGKAATLSRARFCL